LSENRIAEGRARTNESPQVDFSRIEEGALRVSGWVPTDSFEDPFFQAA